MRAPGVETVANRCGPAADGPHSFFRRSMRAAAALTIARAAIIAISLSAWRPAGGAFARSEEHTSELQSQSNLVCRLLLEKKKPQLTTRYCVFHASITHAALAIAAR